MCLPLWTFLFPFSVAEKHLDKAESFMEEYRTSHLALDLQNAIQNYQAAYSLSNQKHSNFTPILINYAAALNIFDGASNSNSRPQIILLLQDARRVMELSDHKPSTYPTVLNNLGQCHLDQYKDNKDKNEYLAAIDTFHLAQNSGPYLPPLIGLATALCTSCELHHSTDPVSDLTNAIGYLNDVVDRSKEDSDTQAECFKHLGSAYNLLFQCTKDPLDLDKSVVYNEKAVDFLRSFDPNLPVATVNLAQQYYVRFTLNRKSSDLRLAHENNNKARILVKSLGGVEKSVLQRQIDDLDDLLSNEQN